MESQFRIAHGLFCDQISGVTFVYEIPDGLEEESLVVAILTETLGQTFCLT